MPTEGEGLWGASIDNNLVGPGGILMAFPRNDGEALRDVTVPGEEKLLAGGTIGVGNLDNNAVVLDVTV
jgi:hypothetical protein